MTKQPSKPRPYLFIGLALFAIVLAVLHFYYPLHYIYRVFVYQDSDFSDIYQFPARTIAASDSPSELPIALDSRVDEIVKQYPGIDDFAAFLEETETTSFLVVHKNQLIEERYLQGHDKESFQNTFSVSKSVMSALVGLAVRDGVLELNAPITQYLPELGVRDERFSQITVEQLLDMRSGISYESGVEFPFVNADDSLIYYHPNLESVVLERTTVGSTPGIYKYNNYNPPLLGLILYRTTGMYPAEYLEQELWNPMGAEGSAGWTTDDHGLERMESGFHAQARDLARFGMLYLDQGQAADNGIIPESWILESTSLPNPLKLDKYDGRYWKYQLGWWIIPRPGGLPDFCAIGRYGQFIYVSPQYDTVIIRTGPGRGDWDDKDWTALFYYLAKRL